MNMQRQFLTIHATAGADTQDPLISQAEENELYILAAIVLVLVLLVIGLINRRIENMLFFALFLSTILIFLVMALFA
jgi:uncharacterized membrane protein